VVREVSLVQNLWKGGVYFSPRQRIRTKKAKQKFVCNFVNRRATTLGFWSHPGAAGHLDVVPGSSTLCQGGSQAPAAHPQRAERWQTPHKWVGRAHDAAIYMAARGAVFLSAAEFHRRLPELHIGGVVTTTGKSRKKKKKLLPKFIAGGGVISSARLYGVGNEFISLFEKRSDGVSYILASVRLSEQRNWIIDMVRSWKEVNTAPRKRNSNGKVGLRTKGVLNGPAPTKGLVGCFVT
ncbi:surface protease GP63, partial [Trypanosoma cruzi]